MHTTYNSTLFLADLQDYTRFRVYDRGGIYYCCSITNSPERRFGDILGGQYPGISYPHWGHVTGSKTSWDIPNEDVSLSEKIEKFLEDILRVANVFWVFLVLQCANGKTRTENKNPYYYRKRFLVPLPSHTKGYE